MSDEQNPALVYLYTTHKQFQEYHRHGSIPAGNDCPFSINSEWEVSAQWMTSERPRRRVLKKRLASADLVFGFVSNEER